MQRLGFIGDEYKIARKVLLETLRAIWHSDIRKSKSNPTGMVISLCDKI